MAVSNANQVLKSCQATPIESLRDLFTDQTPLLTTSPELDHYEGRQEGRYVGPLLGHWYATRVDWPTRDGPKVFAYLRPDTPQVKVLLEVFKVMPARLVCAAPGFRVDDLSQLQAPRARYCLGPVDVRPLLDADLCITYGAEGTMMRFLLAGVPQLIAPHYVDSYMAARRIEANGLGGSLGDSSTPEAAAEAVQELSTDLSVRAAAKAFSERAAQWRPAEGIASVVCGGRP